MLVIEPAVEIAWLEHDRHGLGVHFRDGLVGLAGEKGHECTVFGRPPDACEREQWMLAMRKPHLRLSIAHGIRCRRPFAKLRDRHEAASCWVPKRRTPERA